MDTKKIPQEPNAKLSDPSGASGDQSGSLERLVRQFRVLVETPGKHIFDLVDSIDESAARELAMSRTNGMVGWVRPELTVRIDQGR